MFKYQIIIPFQFDPAIQRYASMKASNFDYFKVTPKTTKYGLVPMLCTVFGFAWLCQTKRVRFCLTQQIYIVIIVFLSFLG